MRKFLLSLFLFTAVLLPTVGSAQAVSRPTPDPGVDAANAAWQVVGEPIFHAGNFYYPAGPVVFFDGNVMVRTGHYEGVPLYSDTTIEPYSIVLVPIGGNLMKPYERRREGELAGSVGSRVPSFPVETNPDVVTRPTITFAVPGGAATAVAAGPTSVGTTGSALAPRFVPIRLESIPAPTSNGGVWIEYGGERWYLSGPAAPYQADRFMPIGSYRGFPVYRARGEVQRIYVSVLQDGPVAPYERR